MARDDMNEYVGRMRAVHMDERQRARLATAVEEARSQEAAKARTATPSTAHPSSTRKSCDATMRHALANPAPRTSRSRFTVMGRRIGAAAAAVGLVATTAAASLGVFGAEGFPLAQNENAFALEAYAQGDIAKAPNLTEELTENILARNVGGYFGNWENVETGAVLDDTLGYCFLFDIACTGNNMESVTYAIEGDDAYFGLIDDEEDASESLVASWPKLNKYSVAKEFTVDAATAQQFGRGDADARYLSQIILALPMDDDFRAAYDEALAAEEADVPDASNLSYLIETNAAKRISECKLHVTATFTDGSTDTKTYLIAPVDDFDEIYADYAAAQDARIEAERNGEDASDMYSPEPTMYTITEIEE